MVTETLVPGSSERAGNGGVRRLAADAEPIAGDEVLRARFARLTESMSNDDAGRALVEVVAEGLAAIHERQGNLITLMLRTNQ